MKSSLFFAIILPVISCWHVVRVFTGLADSNGVRASRHDPHPGLLLQPAGAPLGGDHLHAGSKDQARAWINLEDHPPPFLLFQPAGAPPGGDHLHAGRKDQARAWSNFEMIHVAACSFNLQVHSLEGTTCMQEAKIKHVHGLV